MNDLEKSEIAREKFFGIINLAEDAIVSTNPNQEIVLFNHGAERLFGYSSEEVIGKSLDMLIPLRFRSEHSSHFREFDESKVVSRLMGDRRQVRGLKKDGSEFPVEVSISRLDLPGETLFTAIVRDATERLRYQNEILSLNQDLEKRVVSRTEELQSTSQQLWQAAKLASVGELAASIAHEINNPLGTVSLRVESILAMTPSEDPRRRLLEIVEQEVERIASLVANLLQFSRYSKDQISTVDVCEEMSRTLELALPHLRRKGVIVEPEVAPNVPMIHADRQKLRQVFLNLFVNAGDAMPNGGTLIPRIRLSEAEAGKPAVLIEIIDTGIGISEENLPKIMEPFFTTKEEGKGTGLGLAICKRIIQDHRGKIEIQSEKGIGTTVRIVLPLRDGSNVESVHTKIT